MSITPRFVKTDKKFITGLFGNINNHAELLKDFNSKYKERPFEITDKYRCELPFWSKGNPKGIRKKGENYFIGFKTEGAILLLLLSFQSVYGQYLM